jgi:hypothetical protein
MEMFQDLQRRGFDIEVRNHAAAILSVDFPEEASDLIETLSEFTIDLHELISGGGGESGQTQRLRHSLSAKGWRKHNFLVQTIVDGQEREAMSHEIDHVCRAEHGVLALEIEWNNKDPFFDRDLENFQRLHAQSAISLGVVVTRGRSMQDNVLNRIREWMVAKDLRSDDDLERLGIGERTSKQKAAVATQVKRGVPYAEAFSKKFVADKFGTATTHWAKLDERIRRGVGNPCPLVLVGLPDSILID